MKMYQNRDTGELLTREEMLKQWREDYDGDDPTNPLHYSEQYDEIEQPDGGDDKPPKLELGQVVQTRGIYEACQEDEALADIYSYIIRRHDIQGVEDENNSNS